MTISTNFVSSVFFSPGFNECNTCQIFRTTFGQLVFENNLMFVNKISPKDIPTS